MLTHKQKSEASGVQPGREVIQPHGDLGTVIRSQGEGGGAEHRAAGAGGHCSDSLLSSEKHSVLHLVPINITSKGEQFSSITAFGEGPDWGTGGLAPGPKRLLGAKSV